jgi:hypothetical protein
MSGLSVLSPLPDLPGRDPSLPDVMFDLAAIAAIALLFEWPSRHSLPSMARKLLFRESRDAGVGWEGVQQDGASPAIRDKVWTRRRFY